MEQKDNTCPNCDQEIPNNVLYQCIICFTKYCAACPESRSGSKCPKCGQMYRMVLDQGKSDQGAD